MVVDVRVLLADRTLLGRLLVNDRKAAGAGPRLPDVLERVNFCPAAAGPEMELTFRAAREEPLVAKLRELGFTVLTSRSFDHDWSRA